MLLINLKLLKIANSFLLNVVKHENFSAMKMPPIVGIFLFIRREDFMLSYEKISWSADLSTQKVLQPWGPGHITALLCMTMSLLPIFSK